MDRNDIGWFVIETRSGPFRVTRDENPKLYQTLYGWGRGPRTLSLPGLRNEAGDDRWYRACGEPVHWERFHDIAWSW